MLIVNKPGGSGIIGAQAAIQAPAGRLHALYAGVAYAICAPWLAVAASTANVPIARRSGQTIVANLPQLKVHAMPAH